MTEQRAPHLPTWLLAGSVAGAALLGLVGQPSGLATRVLGQRIVANGGGTGTAPGQVKDNGSDKKDYTISGSATGLYPGAAKPLPLTFANQNNFPIKVDTFSVAISAPSASCAASNIRVDPLPSVVIPANGTTTQTVLVRMSNDSPNACKNATFGLTYTGTAVKA